MTREEKRGQRRAKPRQLAMESHLYDVLSDAAKEVLRINDGASYARLVVHGDGDPTAAKRLRAIAVELLRTKPTHRQSAALLLAGLWLWHDWLDESHRISQQV